ncbi:MAG: RraA family protein, partial [Runella sp.]
MSVETYKKEVGMMNLEKLIQQQEAVTEAKSPIADKELLMRFEQLYTGAVNDVLREFCLLNQALPNHI